MNFEYDYIKEQEAKEYLESLGYIVCPPYTGQFIYYTGVPYFNFIDNGLKPSGI